MDAGLIWFKLFSKLSAKDKSEHYFGKSEGANHNHNIMLLL